MEFERTLLVSDVGYLEIVLNEVAPFGSVFSAMVMTPPWMNASVHWCLEHVQVSTTVPGQQTGQPHVRLTVEHGRTYDLLRGKKVENAAMPALAYETKLAVASDAKA